MRVQTKAFAYAVGALALAGAVIFSGSTLGVFPTGISSFNPSASAALSILLTDPPSVPEGVTAVNITYTGVAVHPTAFPSGSGWIQVGGHGTLDTLRLVNVSQTISSSNVPTGAYNLVAFTVSAATVEFDGSAYNATINSGKLVVPIIGGLLLNQSRPAAAVIDIQPTVLNLGTQTSPQFAIATGAKAFQVPSGEVVPEMKTIGYKFTLSQKPWFHSFQVGHQAVLNASGTTLTQNSFKITVSNPTSDSVSIRMIIISTSAEGKGAHAGLGGSVMFAVGSDGSLQPVTISHGTGMGTMMQLQSVFTGSGYQLTSGASHTFSYSGNINTLLSSRSIGPGSQYLVIVLGEGVSYTIAVTAS